MRSDRPFGWRTGRVFNWALGGGLHDDREFFRVFAICTLGGVVIGSLANLLLPRWLLAAIAVTVLLLWGWMILVWHIQSRQKQHR